MSIRAIGSKLFKHGTALVRSVYKREYNSVKIAEKVVPKDTGVRQQQTVARSFALRNVGVQVGLHARKLFVDSVLNRVTNSLAAELRKKAARRMLFGDSGPFLAFVGVSLASGTGILTKDEELEGICLEIREAVSKIKWENSGYEINESKLENEPITLKDLELGAPIEKGCSAVVYAARLIEDKDRRDENESTESSIQATVEITDKSLEINAEINDSSTNYPLALKMMFNYDVQSNAMAILRAMYRETVPARSYFNPLGISNWEMNIASRTSHLSQHPNIVAMYSVFTDFVPLLPGAIGLYPAALPSRFYSEGSGRNMSLFLLMKRYDCSLKQYLSQKSPNIRTAILLLAQMLEGVVHINMQGIAHRDMKSDNILIDMQEDNTPILVITDFGCCLADKNYGLQLPYNSFEIDKGGNTALMAPEIILKEPGTFSVINYSKSDLWAAGTIAYELFGMNNPFYEDNKGFKLNSINYNEDDLPPLLNDVPEVIKALVRGMLIRDPRKRLDPEIAANICQLYLWAPSSWLKPQAKLPTSAEILQWLLCLTTKVLCEGRLNSKQIYEVTASSNQLPEETQKTFSRCQSYSQGRRTYPEYLLISSFLKRAKLVYIKNALNWIHNID